MKKIITYILSFFKTKEKSKAQLLESLERKGYKTMEIYDRELTQDFYEELEERAAQELKVLSTLALKTYRKRIDEAKKRLELESKKEK